MGQFKPMVKMETTEPSIELKLKKGGTVAHKKMKGDTSTGHKAGSKMADGGMLGALAGMPSLVKGPVAPVQRARTPARPSMAARRAAMAAGPRKVMKSGGDVEKELKAHEAKPASKAHAGLKKGGACYKNGGLAKSGIIKSESGKSTISTAERTDRSPAKTGDVKLGNGGGYKTGGVVKGNGGGYATGGVALGNAGGFKKGGSSKKAYASGGSVNNEGKATSMPQGAKRPSSPVSINRLSGTFKKGGNVSSKKLQNVFMNENAPAMKAAKAKLLDKYSPYQKADGGAASDKEFELAVNSYKSRSRGQGAVTDKEKQSVTEKRYPSGLTDTEIDRVINSKPVREGMSRFVDRKRGGKVGK
jgi:hypothetical protein